MANIVNIDLNEEVDEAFEGLDFAKDIKLEVDCEPANYHDEENNESEFSDQDEKLAQKDPNR